MIPLEQAECIGCQGNHLHVQLASYLCGIVFPFAYTSLQQKMLTMTLISRASEKKKMQGIFRAVRSCQETLKAAILQHSHGRGKIFTFGGTTSSSPEQLKGLENVTVAEVLMTKGEEKTGSWLWCRTDDAVIDAVKNMAKNNIGSLVVLKPGEEHLAGIITERDYTRKIVAQGRSPIYTTVGEIMTDKQDNLITVTSDTNILQAMQLMTENRIRHIPVIDGKIVGMISIVDVVRAVVNEQSGELKQMNEFIKGDYY